MSSVPGGRFPDADPAPGGAQDAGALELDAGDRARAVRRVLLLTLGMNVAVAAAKIGYGHVSHSLAIRADGFHSLTDSSNNLVGFVGVYFAARPADAGHPYGHHKLEFFAAGLVGVSLLVMAYDVLAGAFSRWSTEGPGPSLGPGAFAVLLGTLAVNLFVAVYEQRMGKRLSSVFLMTDATHTRSDVLVTLGVLLSSVLVGLGHSEVDLVAAVLIAGFIAWVGIRVLRANLNYLADAAALRPDQVERVVLRVAGVASAHKIRTRGGPGGVHVDLHIQIARHLDVVTAHRVTHWVIDAIKDQIPGVVDVVVHTEPAAPGQPYNPLP